MPIRAITLLVLSSLLLSCSSVIAQPAYKSIDVSNKNIQVLGANYVFRKDSTLSYCRFSEAALNAPMSEAMFNADKARTNSGIRLRFQSASSKIRLTFVPDEGQNRGSEFAVLQNDVLKQTFAFKGEKSKGEMQLAFENVEGEKANVFEIVLPSFANVSLVKMELLDNADLIALPVDERRIYLAIGNSITHGVGQGSATYLTYPYLLAQKLNCDYYNLAVGGAKISPAIAKMCAEMPQADLITILIGYNDWMSNGKTVQEYVSAYKSYLKEIRKHQPNAKIYCITLTHTRATHSETTGIKPNEYREALSQLLGEFQQNGDDLLYLVKGDEITSEANLRTDVLKDKVHFGIEGASLFADELYKIISQ